MKNHTFTRYLGYILVIVALIILWHTTLKNYIKLEYIQHHQEALKNFISNNYATACIAYVALYATIIVCMLSLTLLVTTYAGFLFGTFTATALSITGALLGCTISFLVIRYVLYRWLTHRYSAHLEKFTKKFKEHGVLYLLTLYFFPLTPYAVVTTLAALSNMRLITFLWTTAVGILPITVLCSFAGKKLATLTSIKDILSLPMLLGLIALSLLALLPALIKIKNKS